MLVNKLRQIREDRAEGDKGFTLIELLVVVVIIGILVAIAIPIYLNYEHGAQNRSAQSDARNAVAAIEQCKSDNADVLPAAPTPAISTDETLTCVASDGTSTTETLAVSDGNTLTYLPAVSAGTYTVTVVGANKTYRYDSTTGKIAVPVTP